MSYSFQVRAATKTLVRAAVAASMAEVVQAQPVHKHDAGAAIAAAESYVALLPEDDTQDVIVSVNGWLEWLDGDEIPAFLGVSVGVSARLIAREPVAEAE